MSEHLSRRQALKVCTALAALGSSHEAARGEDSHLAASREVSSASVHFDISRVQHVIEQLLERTGLPGLSIAVINDGRLAWAQGFGYANERTRQPVTEDTIFQAASLTKPTFAYVMLKLCDEDRLNLDVPLMRKYLPDPAPSTDPGAERITARMVLAHMSGLPFTHFPKWPLKMDFEPGEKFGYSGAAYIYLQQVVEQLLGKPLVTIMNEYVIGPLALTDSAYVWRPNYQVDAAIAYDYDNTPIKEAERSRPENACAAASLHSTPKDFARFLIELLFRKNGVLRLDYTLKRMMLSPQVRLTNNLAWGLGWGLRLAEDGDRFWHWGDSRGYVSYAAGSLSARRGVVIFTNGRHGLRVAEQVAAKVMGPEEMETFAWIYDGFYPRYGLAIPPLPTGSAPSRPAQSATPHKAAKPLTGRGRTRNRDTRVP